MDVICVILLINVIITQAEDKREEITKLEKEKEDIFKQIHLAINDTIKSFKKSYDNEAVLGISYMEELREQIKDANKTGKLKIDLGDKNTSKEITLDTRRHKKIKLSILDIANVFTRRPSKSKQQRGENQEIMQNRIDDWIKQRELEREKIKQYKVQQMRERMKYKYEKCPRFGKESKKKKGMFRRNAPGGLRYPCCRKCCKKSYMGCL